MSIVYSYSYIYEYCLYFNVECILKPSAEYTSMFIKIY